MGAVAYAIWLQADFLIMSVNDQHSLSYLSDDIILNIRIWLN